MKIKFIFFLLSPFFIFSQYINVNDNFNYSFIRNSTLLNEIESNYSFNIKPLEVGLFHDLFKNQYRTIYENNSKTIEIKSLGVDYFIEFNSKHPYNRNNGTMIPNRGYQHIISPGIYVKAGPLTIQFKPEHHYSQNRVFDCFLE